MNAFSLLYLSIYVIAYIILFIATLILLALVLPLNITLQSTVDEPVYEGAVKIDALLGVIQGSVVFNSEGGLFKLRLFWLQAYSRDLAEAEKSGEKQKEKPEKKTHKGNPTELLSPTMRLFSSLTRKIKLKKLDLDLTAGLSDPYAVGCIFGAAYPIVETARVFYPAMNISLNPVFTEEVFRSKLDGRVSLRIIMLVVPLLRFYYSNEFRAYRRS